MMMSKKTEKVLRKHAASEACHGGRDAFCSSVSTPSATTVIPRALPMEMIASRMALRDLPVAALLSPPT